MRFLMVVLSFNNATATAALLDRIRSGWASTNHQLLVHVVDNGSDPEHAALLAQEDGSTHPGLSIRIDRLPENLGFAGGVNWAISANEPDSYDAIVLSNDDLELDTGTLEHLFDEFTNRPDIWVLAPAIQHSRHTEPLVGGDISWLFRVHYHAPYEVPGTHKVGFVPFTFAVFREVPHPGANLLSEAVFFGEEDVAYALHCKVTGKSVAVDDRVIVKHDASQTRRRNSSADQLDERLLGAASRSVTVRAVSGWGRWQLWRVVTLVAIAVRTFTTVGPRRFLRFTRQYWQETDRVSLGRDDFYRLAKMHA